MVSIRVSGRAIIAACERSLTGLPLDYGYFSQVSGMSLTFRDDVEPGKRVVSVKVGGAQIGPNREYTIATTQFIAEGGDGTSCGFIFSVQVRLK